MHDHVYFLVMSETYQVMKSAPPSNFEGFHAFLTRR
jgi:hypothetical protein